MPTQLFEVGFEGYNSEYTQNANMGAYNAGCNYSSGNSYGYWSGSAFSTSAGDNSGDYAIAKTYLQVQDYNTGEYLQFYSSAGNMYIGGILYQNYFSDAKYKDNVVELTNSLDKISAMRGVEFDWNALAKQEQNKEGHEVGMIAQEVQAVYPAAVRQVSKERETNVVTALVIDYEKLIPLIVESIKELKLELDLIKNR